MYKKILENTKAKTPLVDCITNYVTVNDCANVILAIGGSPIMADDGHEVADIVDICSSLVINMGTLSTNTLEAMVVGGKESNKILHPVVLDPVGAGASQWRNDGVKRLINEVQFSVIRGNISEIKAVYKGSGNTQGVDASADDIITEDNLDKNIEFAKELSKKTGAVIAISGAIDIVCNEKTAYIIRNGHENMSKITGSGCMLTAVIGAICGANYDDILGATVTSVVAMGISGELAQIKMQKEDTGLSSFRTYLIDFMSKMDYNTIKGGAKVEIR